MKNETVKEVLKNKSTHVAIGSIQKRVVAGDMKRDMVCVPAR